MFSSKPKTCFISGKPLIDPVLIVIDDTLHTVNKAAIPKDYKGSITLIPSQSVNNIQPPRPIPPKKPNLTTNYILLLGDSGVGKTALVGWL